MNIEEALRGAISRWIRDDLERNIMEGTPLPNGRPADGLALQTGAEMPKTEKTEPFNYENTFWLVHFEMPDHSRCDSLHENRNGYTEGPFEFEDEAVNFAQSQSRRHPEMPYFLMESTYRFTSYPPVKSEMMFTPAPSLAAYGEAPSAPDDAE